MFPGRKVHICQVPKTMATPNHTDLTGSAVRSPSLTQTHTHKNEHTQKRARTHSRTSTLAPTGAVPQHYLHKLNNRARKAISRATAFALRNRIRMLRSLCVCVCMSVFLCVCVCTQFHYGDTGKSDEKTRQKQLLQNRRVPSAFHALPPASGRRRPLPPRPLSTPPRSHGLTLVVVCWSRC